MVTATLAGVPDTIPPTLTLTRDGATDDPFSSLVVIASEPLPPGARPVLVADGGAETPLLPRTGSANIFVSVFDPPATLLHYGQQYRVAVDGIADFAGNLARSEGTTFTTRAAPPLVAEDGFETATGTTLGGAQVLTGSGAPTITGTHSLYIPSIARVPIASLRPRTTRLALRLAVAPGDTVIRFGYRLVNPYNSVFIMVGSEGGKLGSALLAAGPPSTTTATIAGQGQVSLGALATAEIPLPTVVGSEVVIAEILSGYPGGLPNPPNSGVIIDDLRVE